jgi:hypothetical protein
VRDLSMTCHVARMAACSPHDAHTGICWAAAKLDSPAHKRPKRVCSLQRHYNWRLMMPHPNVVAKDQVQLVAQLAARSIIQSQRTIDAMSRVDRGCFVHNLERPARIPQQYVYQVRESAQPSLNRTSLRSRPAPALCMSRSRESCPLHALALWAAPTAKNHPHTARGLGPASPLAGPALAQQVLHLVLGNMLGSAMKLGDVQRQPNDLLQHHSNSH